MDALTRALSSGRGTLDTFKLIEQFPELNLSVGIMVNGLMIGIFFIPVTTLCCHGAPSQAQAKLKDMAKCFGSETFCVQITVSSARTLLY